VELERYTLDGTVDLVKVAVEQLRTYESSALQMHPGGYYVAYSGGKDSDVIRILCQLAGVKHELWHNHTTVDAPETVRYVRTIVPKERISRPDMSMWRLIASKTMPPTRIFRYCCEELKERNGGHRFIVTGVRKSESNTRANREMLEVKTKNHKKRKIFTDDNDENKRIIYHCMQKSALIMNPIIEWHENDVWDFLRYYGCESNPLYKCGCKRIGCIGCPMQTVKQRLEEFKKYPKYKELYIRAFDKMLKNPDKKFDWQSGEEVFDWWTSEKAETIDENQLTFFDGEADEDF